MSHCRVLCLLSLISVYYVVFAQNVSSILFMEGKKVCYLVTTYT